MGEVSIEFPAHLPNAAAMAASARGVAQLPEGSDREEAMSTLFKIIDNVIAAPSDVKKRRLKKSNEAIHRKVGRHECAVAFLRASGFVDSDDPDLGEEGRGTLLSMPVAYIVRLTDAHHSLASAAAQVSLPVPPLPACPVFNPYASHTQAMDPTRSVKAPASHRSEAERVSQELRERQAAVAKAAAGPPVPLSATAFWSAAGRRLEEIVRETSSVGDSETGDGAIVGAQLGGVKAAINGSNLKFESAEKRALDQMVRKRVHETCILRVNCPDKSVLQVHFRAGDKGEYVMSQVGPLLAPHVRESSWYLYQSPPLQKLQPRETLTKAGYPPGANLYLGFDGAKPGPPFFEPSLQASMGPPPEDQGRGVNAIAGHLSGEAMGWGVGQTLGSAPAGAAGPGAAAAARAAAAAGPAPASAPMDVDGAQ